MNDNTVRWQCRYTQTGFQTLLSLVSLTFDPKVPKSVPNNDALKASTMCTESGDLCSTVLTSAGRDRIQSHNYRQMAGTATSAFALHGQRKSINYNNSSKGVTHMWVTYIYTSGFSPWIRTDSSTDLWRKTSEDCRLLKQDLYMGPDTFLTADQQCWSTEAKPLHWWVYIKHMINSHWTLICIMWSWRPLSLLARHR